MPIFEGILGKGETKEILRIVSIEVIRTSEFVANLPFLQSASDEVKKLLTAKKDEALTEGSLGLPWYVGEYLDSGKRAHKLVERSYKR